MKIVDMAKIDSAKARKQVAAETQILSELHHKNIIKFFDTFEESYEICTVLEL
jgi:serine/threonine protein kinase